MRHYFNTTGPCLPDLHYMLPPEARLPELDKLIADRLNFVLHAPRQTGKTTAMMAFAARLRREGAVALLITFETSQGVEDIPEAEPLWLQAIAERIETLPDEDRPPSTADLANVAVGARLAAMLTRWARAVAPRPVVLLIDEADVVSGPALVNLLRQLRSGFGQRPAEFPSSIALIGLRDLRDYLTAAKDGREVNPGSPFNIKAKSLTLAAFTREDVATLYAQHTADSGQSFLPEAVDRAFHWSQGQPFIVNALANIAVERLTDRSVAVTPQHIDEAKEHLVLSRTTHLDSLARRLRDARIVPIIEAMLVGDLPAGIDTTTDDFDYAVDLGLVRKGKGGPEIANPLYREVLARVLSQRRQDNLPPPWWPWLRPDGGLDFAALVEAFIAWWRENADILREHDDSPYREAAAHLSFMGFLQRVVNGGGTVEREYAAGRGRIDLVITFGGERFVVELKRVPPTWSSLETVRAQGIAQLSGYLDRTGVLTGWLIIFDQRPGRTWDERCWRDELDVDGRRLLLRGA